MNDCLQGPTVPPHPPGGLGGDDEEDTYEEAEPYVASETNTGTADTAEEPQRV